MINLQKQKKHINTLVKNQRGDKRVQYVCCLPKTAESRTLPPIRPSLTRPPTSRSVSHPLCLPLRVRPPAGRPELWTSGGSRPSHSPMSSGCHSEWSWHGRYANPLSFKLSQEAGTQPCLSPQWAEHTHTHTHTHAHIWGRQIKPCNTELSRICILD